MLPLIGIKISCRYNTKNFCNVTNKQGDNSPAIAQNQTKQDHCDTVVIELPDRTKFNIIWRKLAKYRIPTAYYPKCPTVRQEEAKKYNPYSEK